VGTTPATGTARIVIAPRVTATAIGTARPVAATASGRRVLVTGTGTALPAAVIATAHPAVATVTALPAAVTVRRPAAAPAVEAPPGRSPIARANAPVATRTPVRTGRVTTIPRCRRT
jgi:hypothetical protein